MRRTDRPHQHRTPATPHASAFCRPALAVLAALALSAPAPAHPSSREFIPVGDPLESELRLLDLISSGGLGQEIWLAHLHTRPLQLSELRGPGAYRSGHDPARDLSLLRIERFLARDLPPALDSLSPAAVPGVTPRLFESRPDPTSHLQFSAGLVARAEAGEPRTRIISGSGTHFRAAAQREGILAYTDLLVAKVDSVPSYTDPLVANSDILFTTEETYLAWATASGGFSIQAGRSRHQWGPGEEAGLLVSRTSVPLSGITVRAGFRSLRLDFESLSATLAGAEGRQLAGHRIEWQPLDPLRVGLSETAVYHSPGWDPLYAIGIIPYSLVQRLQTQDEPNEVAALRNNVTAGVDAAWRLADGSRVYGELLVDDLHVKTATVPNKWGFLLGWEGVAMVGQSRLSWGGEFVRLSRYVYTSAYDCPLAAQAMPIGYPTGPDSRRVRVRGAWDWSADWQITASVSQTDRGEGALDRPYVPGTHYGRPMSFEGVVERSRDAEAGVRWWPASGIDLAVSGGWREARDCGHVAGASCGGLFGALQVRLSR